MDNVSEYWNYMGDFLTSLPKEIKKEDIHSGKSTPRPSAPIPVRSPEAGGDGRTVRVQRAISVECGQYTQGELLPARDSKKPVLRKKS